METEEELLELFTLEEEELVVDDEDDELDAGVLLLPGTLVVGVELEPPPPPQLELINRNPEIVNAFIIFITGLKLPSYIYDLCLWRAAQALRASQAYK